jgi:Cu(I)/Ag(I) efflux system membrane protein CusA/SilA
MTFATTGVGLFPIMWATGAGSDVMKRIAAAMVGGILTSFILELLVYPAIYEVWKWGLDPHSVQEDQSSTALGFEPVESSGSD